MLNKSDLPNEYDENDLKKLLPNKEIITTSIATGIGIDKLEQAIKEMFYAGELEIESDIIVTNMRHKDQLIKAKKNIEDGLEGIMLKIPLDCIEVDIKNCWENLGKYLEILWEKIFWIRYFQNFV